uniref:Uncharacterized protein n=1 Tax=Romanomermis culicivorax TaxID=13658 RepID=A0A915IGR3_ROMCU
MVNAAISSKVSSEHKFPSVTWLSSGNPSSSAQLQYTLCCMMFTPFFILSLENLTIGGFRLLNGAEGHKKQAEHGHRTADEVERFDYFPELSALI